MKWNWRRFSSPRASCFVLSVPTVSVPSLITLALLGWASWTVAEPLSPRNASYEIQARLDTDTRIITGRQILTWRNIQNQPTNELWFHLYWNGFRNNQSTWIREDRLRGRSDIESPEDDDWAFLDVDRIRLLGDEKAELTSRFESPDDGNPHDRSVMVVDLPREVAPDETIQVELEWRARVPRTFARTGYRGEFYFIAHWFPKLGVFEPEGWNCHQFHSATEFYSDYGSYDVRLTLPERFVVGATGQRKERIEGDDGTITHRFVQDDVHGFTWTASPDYLEARQRFEVPGLPPVDMRLLYQPEHAHQVERHFAATRVTLEHYGTWYGPYPYAQITIVDPAFQAGVGGMEYPTLFTAGTRNSRPFGGGSPEGVTIHEAGHQFWYGLVGNNEQEFAWLDEGLNTFSTARTSDVAFGQRRFRKSYLNPPGTDLGGFVTVLFPDAPLSRSIHGNNWARFVSGTTTSAGPLGDPTYLYFPSQAGSLSYSKTAIWLETLERYLGWETLQRILSTFFERWKFDHPRPKDLFAIADEVSGQDLGWFFDQVHGSAVHFDYAVDSVVSKSVEARGFGDTGLIDSKSEPGGDEDASNDTELFRTEVVVRRHGLGTFPLELLLVFEDGSEKRFDWDGQATWKVFVEERAAKLDYAALDPERVLLLDTDYSNNSRLMKSQAEFPARKWASKWMIWLQDFLHTFTFFV